MNLMLSQLLSSLLLVSPLHTLPVCRVIRPQSQVSSRSEHQPGQLGFVYFLKDISQTQTRPEITSHFKIRARGGGRLRSKKHRLKSVTGLQRSRGDRSLLLLWTSSEESYTTNRSRLKRMKRDRT